MKVVIELAQLLIFLYILTLFARVILDLVRTLARDWRPKGLALILSELIYALTDPPLRFLRRVIPPLSLGRVRLDLAFMVLLILCYILSAILGAALAGLR